MKRSHRKIIYKMRYLEDDLEDCKEICEKSHVDFLDKIHKTFPDQHAKMLDESVGMRASEAKDALSDLKKKRVKRIT